MTTQPTHDEQSGAEFTAAEQPYVPASVADSTLADVAPSVSSATPEEPLVSTDSGTSANETEGKQEIAETEGIHNTQITAIAPPVETPAPATASTEEAQPGFMPEGFEQSQELQPTTTVSEAQAASSRTDDVPETANIQAEQTTPEAASQSDTPVTETGAIAHTTDAPTIEETNEAASEEPSVVAEAMTAETAETSEMAQEMPSLEQVLSEALPPFTAFIEEFRQAEARLNVSRQDSVSESFESFESFALFPTIGETSFSSTFSAEQITGELSKAEQAGTDEATEQTEQPTTSGPYFHFAESGLTQGEEQAASTVEQSTSQSAGEENAATTEQESRRPARRYRFDRPTTTNGFGTTSAPVAASATPSPTREDVKETREPREPREPKEAIARAGSASNGNGHNGHNGQNSFNNNNTTPVVEKLNTQSVAQLVQPVLPAPVTQEADSTESSTPTPVSSEPERRRRHGQERREKEQATSAPSTSSTIPTPTQETIAPIMEQTSPMLEEIAPEDLPPLEYADLQKSNGRRRRRHRPGTPNTPATSSVNSNDAVPMPMPLVEPTRPEPVAPSRPSTATTPINSMPAINKSNEQAPSPYSIVSGYTVNQMNQGSENTGPFMGPEPSPARGSVLSREGRTVRAETQRMPIYPAHGAGREGASASSIHQLSSVLSQAIQTQTDRMVAELRRANQAPTNVSVSIPPFPSTERVGVFVDVANLLYSARTMRISIDFGKLLDFLRGNRRLIRAHAYCPTSPQAGDEQMFLQAVKGLGYRITTKNYKTFASGAKKADLDLDLCMDIVRLVDGRAIDCVVLVSGDSDFMPVLDYCSDHGVRVEVAAFDEAMSATLRQSCDLFVNLSMLQEIRS